MQIQTQPSNGQCQLQPTRVTQVGPSPIEIQPFGPIRAQLVNWKAGQLQAPFQLQRRRFFLTYPRRRQTENTLKTQPACLAPLRSGDQIQLDRGHLRPSGHRLPGPCAEVHIANIHLHPSRHGEVFQLEHTALDLHLTQLQLPRVWQRFFFSIRRLGKDPPVFEHPAALQVTRQLQIRPVQYHTTHAGQPFEDIHLNLLNGQFCQHSRWLISRPQRRSGHTNLRRLEHQACRLPLPSSPPVQAQVGRRLS